MHRGFLPGWRANAACSYGPILGSVGDGLDYGRERGAETAGDLEEFYGRAMPALDQIAEADFVRLTQLYGRYATVTAEDGSERFEGEPTWSETDLVQQIARWPGGRAWYTVEPAALQERVRERTVAEMIEAARAAGAPVEEDGRVSVLVRAAVTQTLGGLRIDPQARVKGADDLYAAGADVGGIATGAIRAGSPPRSSSAASPPRRRWPRASATGAGPLVGGKRRQTDPGHEPGALLTVELNLGADRRRLALPG